MPTGKRGRQRGQRNEKSTSFSWSSSFEESEFPRDIMNFASRTPKRKRHQGSPNGRSEGSSGGSSVDKAERKRQRQRSRDRRRRNYAAERERLRNMPRCSRCHRQHAEDFDCQKDNFINAEKASLERVVAERMAQQEREEKEKRKREKERREDEDEDKGDDRIRSTLSPSPKKAPRRRRSPTPASREKSRRVRSEKPVRQTRRSDKKQSNQPSRPDIRTVETDFDAMLAQEGVL